MNIQSAVRNAHQFHPDQLEIAPENPRSDETVDAVAIQHLADSIEAIGVLTPLLGYEYEGKVFITAGGRRTRAIRLLSEEGRLDAGATVPVTVLPQAEAIDAGHAEQLTHQIMSDLDTIKVFGRPEYASLSDAQLGKLVGRSAQYVKQRRRILSLPETAIEHLFASEITVSQAAGLTYWTEDEEGFAEQLNYCINNPHVDGDDLRAAYTRQCSEWSKNALTKIVTQEEYQAAGGKLQGDLFSEERFILSPGVLEALANAAAQKIVAEKFPDALRVIHLEGQWYGQHRRHYGIDNLTDDEADEWSDIRYDFSDWREYDEAELEEEGELEEYRRWKELKSKAEKFWPEDLEKHLIVGWSLSARGNDPIQTVKHIIPEDDELVMESLYEKGYLDRPKEQPEADGSSGAAQAKDEGISQALAKRIQRIKAHCVRQDMMKRPNEVFEKFLIHIAVPSWNEAYFSYRPEAHEHLGNGDPQPLYSTAWEKAMALDSSEESALTALKPAEQRTVLAMRILDCLRADRLPQEVTPQDLRAYVSLDAGFFKAYKKPQMVQMLEPLVEDSADDLMKLKNGELAASLADHFASVEEWLPLGF